MKKVYEKARMPKKTPRMIPVALPGPISSSDCPLGSSSMINSASTPAVKARYHGISRIPHFIGSALSNTANLTVKNNAAENPAAMRGAMAQEAAIWLRLPVDQAHLSGV